MKQDLYRALQQRSDGYLLSRRFRTDAPEDELNILPAAPPDVTGALVDSYYRLPKSALKVRCRMCRKEHWTANHRNGFVIRFPDGTGILVGETCGAKHFAADWRTIQHQFDGVRSRQRFLQRRQQIMTAWPPVAEEMNELLRKPWLRRYDIGARSLETRLPSLRNALLRQLTTQGPTIYREERVRDYGAEERAEGRDGTPMYTTVSTPRGTIGGPEFVTATTPLQETVEKLYRSFARKVENLTAADTDTLSDRQLADLVRSVEALAGRLERSVGLLAALQAFIAADNLKFICEWASETDRAHGSYRFAGNGIEWEDGPNGNTVWNRPLIDVPELPNLRRLIQGA